MFDMWKSKGDGSYEQINVMNYAITMTSIGKDTLWILNDKGILSNIKFGAITTLREKVSDFKYYLNPILNNIHIISIDQVLKIENFRF